MSARTREGDALPLAFCPTHNRALSFEWVPWLHEWECDCPECRDGEPDEDGVMRALHPRGFGVTPAAALESLAEALDTTADELTVSESHV